jgi:hypothetical protein
MKAPGNDIQAVTANRRCSCSNFSKELKPEFTEADMPGRNNRPVRLVGDNALSYTRTDRTYSIKLVDFAHVTV